MPGEKTKQKAGSGIVGKSPEQIREELERKSVQLQILQANMQIIREKERALSHRLMELEETKQAIRDIRSVKAESEILVPLGSGNFISGKISGAEKILVGVGGGIAIKKSPDEALKFLDERAAETNSAIQELESQYMKMESETRALQAGG